MKYRLFWLGLTVAAALLNLVLIFVGDDPVWSRTLSLAAFLICFWSALVQLQTHIDIIDLEAKIKETEELMARLSAARPSYAAHLLSGYGNVDPAANPRSVIGPFGPGTSLKGTHHVIERDDV